MTKTTAVATLHSTHKTAGTAEQVTLAFNADYMDERNKAWAKYTPSLSLTMGVADEVATQFALGTRYLLTIEEATDPVEIPEGMEAQEVSFAKNHVYDVLEAELERQGLSTVEMDLISLSDAIVEKLLAAGVTIPDTITDPHGG